MAAGATLFGNRGWGEGLIDNVLNNITGQFGAAQGAYYTPSGFALNGIQKNLDNAGYQLWGDANGGGNMYNAGNQQLGFYNNLGNLFNTSNNYQTQRSNGAQDYIKQSADNLGPTQQLAQQVFAGGGWSPQLQTGFDAAKGFMGSTGTGGGTTAGSVGNGIVGQAAPMVGSYVGDMSHTLGNAGTQAVNDWGVTPILNVIGNSLQDLIKAGGSTQGQQTLGGAGSNAISGGALGVPGLTATGGQGENTALGILQRGGATPYTNAAQNVGTSIMGNLGANQYNQGAQARGLGLLNEQALMNPAQAASLASNQAATGYKNQAEHDQAQALARGGGAGSAVANGAQNRALMEISDNANQGISKAVTDALNQQQQYNLGQQSNATNMIGTGGGLQNSMLNAGTNAVSTGGGLANQQLGTGANLLNELENVAANRFNTGGGMLNNSESLNNARLGLGYNTDLGIQGAATQNQLAGNTMLNSGTNALLNYLSGGNSLINTGGNLQQIQNQMQLGGGNLYSNLLGGANQYALGMGGLTNQLGGTQGNLYNQIFGNEMSGGNLGLQQGVGAANAYNGYFGNQNSYNQMLGQLFNQGAIDPSVSLSGQGMALWQQIVSALGGGFGAGANMAGQQGLASQLIGAAGGVGAAAAGKP